MEKTGYSANTMKVSATGVGHDYICLGRDCTTQRCMNDDYHKKDRKVATRYV